MSLTRRVGDAIDAAFVTLPLMLGLKTSHGISASRCNSYLVICVNAEFAIKGS